jgi:acetoin:2,6-dichlorophenolindophenol oxidoreductase subunit beta
VLEAGVSDRTITYREAINEALRQEMRRDPTVILMGEDVSGGGGRAPEMQDAWGGPLGVTKGLITEFGPERVLDTPITESGFVGAAIGAAATGLRPVAELMFVGFIGVCLDQVMNQAAKLRYMFGGKAKVPVTIRTMIGAGLRMAAQHSTVDYSMLTHIPGLKCVAPSTPYDAKGLLTAAIRDNDPVIYCEHKVLYGLQGTVPEESYVIPLGKGDIKREGRDVTVVAASQMVHTSLKAAEELGKSGISVEVVDVRSLAPLDEETILSSVRKTHRLAVVDEDNPRCGLAADLVALVARKAFDYLDAPPQMVTPPHTPVPFSPVLEDYYLPSSDRVVQAVRATLD